MSRNLVVCCDGTNNQFGPCNTNVVRLVQVLDRDPSRQLVYYDPGVGTLPEPGFVTPVGQAISQVFGLAFGAGLAGKISRAYAFLMAHHQPGDHIYLYGFSRGAYTVRALAGLIHQFGLLPAGNENLIPYLIRQARAGSRLDEADYAKCTQHWDMIRDFRRTFARTQPGSRPGRETSAIKICFLGLWDTVSSVGWAWEPVHYPYTKQNSSVQTVRHAMALDERRAFFR